MPNVNVTELLKLAGALMLLGLVFVVAQLVFSQLKGEVFAHMK